MEQTVYNAYINYGLLLWGIVVKKLESIQKRAIRLITGSNYVAHTEPLFIQLGVLKVQDIFKLRLLKFYYKLCYGTLPQYFNHYREIIERQPARLLRQHLIHNLNYNTRNFGEFTASFL